MKLKFLKSFILLGLLFSFSGIFNNSFAREDDPVFFTPIPTSNSNTTSTSDCNRFDANKIIDQNILRNCCRNPDYKDYSSLKCTEVLLGINEIDTEGLFIKQNPTSFIIVVFQFLLAVIVLVVVYRIVIAGFSMANAGADKDKQFEVVKKVVNAAIGLVLSFSSLGITNIVKKVFLGNSTPENLLRECIELENEGADPQVVEDCKLLQNQ